MSHNHNHSHSEQETKKDIKCVLAKVGKNFVDLMLGVDSILTKNEDQIEETLSKGDNVLIKEKHLGQYTGNSILLYVDQIKHIKDDIIYVVKVQEVYNDEQK